MKRLQIFIHKYYDSIKLILLLCILALVTYTLLSQIHLNALASKERGEAVIEITHKIQEESEKQTEAINRQLQALCFLVIETSGAQALRQIDPPLEEQCRNLASELQQEQQARTVQPNRVAAPTTPVATAPDNQAPAPTVQTPTTSSPPDPDAPATDEPRRLLIVDDLLKSLGVR